MPQSTEDLYARAQALRYTAQREKDPQRQRQYNQVADDMERQLPSGYLATRQQKQKQADNSGIYGWLSGLLGK